MLVNRDHVEQNYFLNHGLGERQMCLHYGTCITQHVEMLLYDSNRFPCWRWLCSLLKCAGLTSPTHVMNWWWLFTSSLRTIPLFLFLSLTHTLSHFLAFVKHCSRVQLPWQQQRQLSQGLHLCYKQTHRWYSTTRRRRPPHHHHTTTLPASLVFYFPFQIYLVALCWLCAMVRGFSWTCISMVNDLHS